MTHLDYFFVLDGDQPIGDHPHGLISPHSDHLGHALKPLGGGQYEAIVDPGQIPEVENVVEFGWRGWEIVDDGLVKSESYFSQLGHDVSNLLAKRPRVTL